MADERIILGIDPGYAILGFGIIRARRGGDIECLGYGSIETESGEELPARLAFIDEQLTQIIEKYKPSEIALEELFFAKNVKTALAVAHARGVALVCAAKHTGKIFEYKPNQVKQATTGVGRADKKQMQFMITRILGLESVPKPDDVADALAVAITHEAFTRAGS